MADVLNVCGISKTFKNFALNNVSFNIQENCITGFLGKNGAGKTTLIKILLGLLKKDSGEITFFSNKYGKDDLIESYRLIKGSLDDLEKIKEVPFKILNQSRYGFTGITKNFHKIQSLNSNIIIEKSNLEDIFLTLVVEE